MRYVGGKGQHGGVSARHIARLLGIAVVTMSALLSAPVPSVSAQPPPAPAPAPPPPGPAPLAAPAPPGVCPDVEVVFARGTFQPPGVGEQGQAFIDALRSQVGARTVNVYPVNYPASTEFARDVVIGIKDASAHVRSTAANCPDTRMVLGGFSQGAAVIGFVTADVVPNGLPNGVVASELPQPMPPEVADHVAAVVLIGKPSERFMNSIPAPPVVVGPEYAEKTLELCVPNDQICDPNGQDMFVHGLYGVNGMADQAAAFVVRRLATSPA